MRRLLLHRIGLIAIGTALALTTMAGASAQDADAPGVAAVLITGEFLNRELHVDAGEYAPIGEILETVTILADGEECGVLNTADPSLRNEGGSLQLALGTADQPVACGRTGATISFRTPLHPGVDLHDTYTLEPGAVILFNNTAPPPPHTGDPDAGHTEDVAPPATGTGTAARTERPYAGLATWLFVAGVGASLAAGARTIRARRERA